MTPRLRTTQRKKNDIIYSRGCHIDGCSANSHSYADDKVLLSPSIRCLQRLLSICEKYIKSHGLVYNSKTSVAMVFKYKNGSDYVPDVPGGEANSYRARPQVADRGMPPA
ncbi:unnamed protein product, partial [Brenthis ino]